MFKVNDYKERSIHSEPRVKGFGIFYGDFSVYWGVNLDDWKEAPKENVQVILLYLDKNDIDGTLYRESICGVDYYAFDGETFTASNDTRTLCSDYILYGKWTDWDNWKAVNDNAILNHKIFGGGIEG